MSVDYEAAYKAAERAYNDAVGEISFCNRRDTDLKQRKSDAEDRISFLEGEIKRNNTAREKLQKLAGGKADIDSARQSEMVAVVDVSNSYYGSVEHSDAYPKFMAGLLRPHDIAVNNRVEKIYEEIGKAITTIDNRIAEYETEIKNQESLIDYLRESIFTNQANLTHAEGKKTNAEYNMAYYKSLMDDA